MKEKTFKFKLTESEVHILNDALGALSHVMLSKKKYDDFYDEEKETMFKMIELQSRFLDAVLGVKILNE